MIENKETLVIVDADGLIYSSSYKSETAEDALAKCKEYVYNIYLNTNADLSTGFLTSSSQRYEIATTKEYKGNRKLLEKPSYFKLLFEYLKDEFNFKVMPQTEADDLCISTYMKYKDTYNCIISSPDKDLKQIEGTFYNPKTYKIEYISQEQADYNFYYQMLVGDTADNIVGVPGIGKVKAAAILDNITPDLYFNNVLAVYQSYYKIPNLAYYHFSENYLLLFLRRNLELDLNLNILNKEEIQNYVDSRNEYRKNKAETVTTGDFETERRENEKDTAGF